MIEQITNENPFETKDSINYIYKCIHLVSNKREHIEGIKMYLKGYTTKEIIAKYPMSRWTQKNNMRKFREICRSQRSKII